ncbi:MAG: acyltransferase [Burkholderiaceae bacterium]|nr:MAG: acyltransferase [Burkholderiaceae bacterium]
MPKLSHFVPHVVRGSLAAMALGLNTLVVFAAMVPAALAKLVLPEGRLRVACDRLLNRLATGWVGFNNAWIAAVCHAPWRTSGVDDLRAHGWYLVSSNHRSWVDIFVLQRVFHRRIPFLKFFLKRELIWVPVIGLAWWALDFPFMRRGAGRRDDLATTRRACERFARIPTAVINFAEGTRFTDAKRSAQRSPYQHLLEPKIGGIGIALATMGEQFECMLDVTIVYPAGTPSFWGLLSGRIGEVIVEVRQLPLDAALLGGDLIRDKAYRNGIRCWIDDLWAQKDRRIAQLLAR